MAEISFLMLAVCALASEIFTFIGIKDGEIAKTLGLIWYAFVLMMIFWFSGIYWYVGILMISLDTLHFIFNKQYEKHPYINKLDSILCMICILVVITQFIYHIIYP